VPLLEVRELTIRFGGHMAVKEVDLDVDAGRITGLIGPNGAGKTTTFNAITGLQELTHGRIVLDGKDVTKAGARDRARLGVARTFQRLEVFGSLTVRENVLVAAEIRRRWARDADADPREDVEAIVDRVGLRPVAGERADSLPTGLARMCELARALAVKPRLLLLDEPASGQSEQETEQFSALLRALADEGMAILIVEHDVGLVMDVCSLVHVLDYGALLAVGTPDEIQGNKQVLDAYLGGNGGTPDTGVGVDDVVAEPQPLIPRVEVRERTADGGGGTPDLPPVLELRNIRAAYGRIEVLHGVDLTVPAGSLVALLGPNGAGKTTALKVASGQMAPTRGCIHLAGRHVNGAATDALPRIGLCTIPEGRGVFPSLTVRENLVMATFAGVPLADVEERAYARFPRLQERRSQLAGTMSGGEQQMLAMARALATEPSVLLLDELSMGLAPLIVEELYGLVAQIAKQGVSILVVEQFARTVLGVADLAAVMLQGRIGAEGAPSEIEAELQSAYLGASL
jgi:ABC-type branched-subunit amino acid transport system ATPase component